MKKLESLEKFNENKLHETHMSMILGGAKVGDTTKGFCTATNASKTGYASYTHDTVLSVDDNGNISSQSNHGKSEIFSDDACLK